MFPVSTPRYPEQECGENETFWMSTVSTNVYNSIRKIMSLSTCSTFLENQSMMLLSRNVYDGMRLFPRKVAQGYSVLQPIHSTHERLSAIAESFLCPTTVLLPQVYCCCGLIILKIYFHFLPQNQRVMKYVMLMLTNCLQTAIFNM